MPDHVPSEHEVETFSGRYVDVDKPVVSTIALEDIAHALANTCRYGGHCTRFYSVAEHAVFVSKRLERKGHSGSIQLAGLHHDDAEAFLMDVPRPMKPLLGKAYERMTAKMDQAIAKALNQGDNVPWFYAEDFHDPSVKDADNWALFVEARYLLPSQGKLWWDGAQGADKYIETQLPSRIVTPDYWLGGIEPQAAEQLYLERHRYLREENT